MAPAWADEAARCLAGISALDVRLTAHTTNFEGAPVPKGAHRVIVPHGGSCDIYDDVPHGALDWASIVAELLVDSEER